MPRFFLPDTFSYELSEPLPAEIVLTGEDAFHLSVSLRCRFGDPVTVCTSTGVEIQCDISSVSGGKKNPVVILSPISASASQVESPIFVSVYQGMPKGKKTDSILQKCTELGASRIVFVYADRSVPQEKCVDVKLERYQKIADEAAKQCGRARRVTVEILPDTDSAVEQMRRIPLSFLCYEEESDGSLKKLLRGSEGTEAAFFIGPEGGISSREVALFRENGIPSVTLGSRILRTETASSAVLSMLLYEKEL